MTPILDKLKEKALAPFREDIPVDTGTTVVRGEDTLSFFPSLPRIRNRRCYEADADKKSKVQLCTKGYNAHPSLTPGIFTIFCPHGQFLFCIIRASVDALCRDDANEISRDPRTNQSVGRRSM